jgi:acyl-CoA thioesterase FadM
VFVLGSLPGAQGQGPLPLRRILTFASTEVRPAPKMEAAMYPFVRMWHQIWKVRNAPRMGLFDTHVSTHRIWPQDLDPWRELNNGRTLTLFDLGRIPMSVRLGFDKVAKANGWGLTVAGNTTRYRKRVTLFQLLTLKSRVLGWDKRFIYMEQSFWREDDCTSTMLVRSGFTSKAGLVNPHLVAEALGASAESPPLPEWVQAWIAADAARPWPPEA